MFDEELAAKVRGVGVVAVLVIDEVEDAVPLAEALLAGGVSVMELTLRTPAAVGALRSIRQAVPEMVAGAGTVLSEEQVLEVADAGASFAVSPGLNSKVLDSARREGLSFAPGIMTPTDIESAVALGCRLLKFFPAGSSGGLAHLKNIAAPYAHLGLDYIPLGGVNAGNMGEYLDFSGVAAIGGSWIAKREAIAAKDWAGITERAREAVGIASGVRG